LIRKYFLLHSSAINDGRIFILIDKGLVWGTPVIPEEEMKKVNDEMRERIKNIKVLKGDIFTLSRRLKCKVFICDEKQTELKLKGIDADVIDIKGISVLARRCLKKGDIVEVNIDDKKRFFLDDGTEVIINGDIHFGKVRCRIKGILETEDIRKIFCEIEE